MNSKLNKLDVEDKLTEIYHLKSIVRYNNRPKLSEETVAEHSFYVALIGLMICDELGTSTECKYEVMIKALLHDMPEMEINDITHDVKTRLHLEDFLAHLKLSVYIFCWRLVCEGAIAIVSEEVFEKSLREVLCLLIAIFLQ